MKTLIVGDAHIEEKSIPELEGIFAEILKIKADIRIIIINIKRIFRPL